MRGVGLTLAGLLWSTVDVASGFFEDQCGSFEHHVFDQAGCPDGSWRYFPLQSKCYKVTQEEGDFMACANHLCGPGTLAYINSQELNDKLFYMIPKKAMAWIGLFQYPNHADGYPQHSADDWHGWVNGCPAEFYNWNGEPDDWCGLNEACAFMKEGDEHGFDLGTKWQDASCTSEFHCICEYPGTNINLMDHDWDLMSEEHDIDEDCELAAIIALIGGIVGCCCCVCCCCACAGGVGWYFRNKSIDERNRMQQQQPPWQQTPVQQMAGQPVMGQPVMGQMVPGVAPVPGAPAPGPEPIGASPSNETNPNMGYGNRPVVQATIVRPS